MERTYRRTTKESLIGSPIMNHIKSQNKHLTQEYLNTLTPMELLALTHPSDRADYVADFYKKNLIIAEDVREFGLSPNKLK